MDSLSPSLRALLLIAVTLYPATLPAEIYTWTREDGTTVYSDVPHPDATELPEPQAQTFRSNEGEGRPQPPPAPGKPKPADDGYSAVTVTAPANDATIWSSQGKLTVSVSCTPALQADHRIAVSVDGQRVATEAGTTVTLSGIERGAHTLTAAILDASGSVLRQSEAVRFHMKQHSILFNRP